MTASRILLVVDGERSQEMIHDGLSILVHTTTGANHFESLFKVVPGIRILYLSQSVLHLFSCRVVDEMLLLWLLLASYSSRELRAIGGATHSRQPV